MTRGKTFCKTGHHRCPSKPFRWPRVLEIVPTDIQRGTLLWALHRTLSKMDRQFFSQRKVAQESEYSADYRGTKAQRTGKRAAGIRSVGYHSSRNILLVVTSAIHFGLVESNGLAELPSGFKCIWNGLPHVVQFAVLLLMVGLLLGVNRFFSNVDKAANARLSRAVSAWTNTRRRAPRDQ